MVDRYTAEKNFDYEINANKVINNDRDIPQRDNEPNGEPETLVGKNLHKFGDLVVKEKPPSSLQRKKNKSKIEQLIQQRTKMNTNNTNIPNKKQLIDTSTNELLLYKPKTKDTKTIYEDLLSLVRKYLLDQPTEQIKSALDVIIALIKSNKTDNEKKQEIESLLGIISNEEINKMYQLCKGLVDFDTNKTYIDDYQEIETNIQFDEMDEKEDNNKSDISLVNEDEDLEKEEENREENIKGNMNENEIEIETDLNKRDLLSVNAIMQNPFWIQVFLRERLKIDDSLILKTEKEIIDILKLSDIRECENKFVLMFKRENFDFIKFLLINKQLIYYTTLLGKCQNKKEKENVIKEICSTKEGFELYEKINSFTKIKKKTSSLLSQTGKDNLDKISNVRQEAISNIIKTNYDLEQLSFAEGSHFNSNKEITLPKGTFKQTKQGYEEIFIPPQKNEVVNQIKEIEIGSLPKWMHKAFQYKDESSNEYKFINDTFNKVQSKVLNKALNTDENLLICAPTSSGKTNIGMMTILRLISHYRIESTSQIQLKQFKVVYIAPMKALVQETVGNFSQRLAPYNMTVKELSGDINLSKYEIENTNIIVTTPEKWDVITRKAGEKTFLDKVKLMIIDEIHLLHDTRGAVLESIIARTLRKCYYSKENIRIIALSATLPNYKDVADFCHVNPEKGLFYFDNSYRPIPLELLYIGITEKKGIKKFLLMNEITYEKVSERLLQGKQIIIFVHSRRETIRTAKNLIEMATTKGEAHKLALSEGKSIEFNAILESDIQNNIIKDKELIPLFKYGIGIHHAGMSRDDKEIVEEYFNNGYLNIIVSTATLAWGVNLPAHTVIIKGTQIYSPEKGQWIELSHLDIMQMMGRAGRVGYGTATGEGIIITSFNELQYYLSLLNQQLPIESQLISALPDILNAEIVSGTVSNIKDAVNWLSFTYLFVRMMKSPKIYNIPEEMKKEDPYLIKRRTDLIHSSALLLEKNGLIKYNVRSGEFSTTQLGKVSSYYYIKYQSIGTYNQYLNPNLNIIDLFRLFSLSNEFKLIPIREEEKKEIEKLLQKVPIPVKGSNEESSSKINILLQAYISNISLESYAISSDMIYVSQNANRIFRALYEICVKRAWCNVSLLCLKICKMIKVRMWSTMSPLRQFGIIPNDILHKIESKEQLTWEKFYDLSPTQISELLKVNKKNAEGIHKLMHTFPRLELTANIQPLTRNCIFVELLIVPNFKWNSNYHKHSELFHVFVEDNDSEVILHHETFALKQRDFGDDETNPEKRISFIVPMIEPMPPQYFIRVVSDNWLNCEKLLAIYFKHLILPEKFPPYTNLLDLHPLSYNGVFNIKKLEAMYTEKYQTMNAIQTQCFKTIYETNNSVFVGATSGNGKTQIAEFAIIKHLTSENKQYLNAPIIYICPNEEAVEEKFVHFKDIFNEQKYKINKFTGQYTFDSSIFDKNELVISSSKNFDLFTRKFKKKKNFNELSLIIIDDIHLLADNECSLELALTRIRYSITNKSLRFIVLSTSLSNANSICDWLNIEQQNCFNFNPNVRQNKLEIFFYGYDNISHKARMNLMTKPIIQLINKHCYINNYKLSTMVYVTDIKSAKNFAIEFLSTMSSIEVINKCLIKKSEEYEEIIQNKYAESSDKLLVECLKNGLAYIHEGMDEEEKEFLLELYDKRFIQLVIITYKMIWKISSTSHVVIIADPVKYDISNGGWIDYNISDMFQIMGRASKTYQTDVPDYVKESERKCLIFFQNSRKEFYKKFLIESFPLESQLNHYLHDSLNTEIANGIIKNKQNCIDWLTWTFFYHRILQNPNYYDLKGKTNEDLNQYLSELIEVTLTDLVQAQCISVNEKTGEITSLNLGKISSFYNVLYNTIDLYNQSLHENSNKLSELFQILSNSYEFDYVDFNKGDIQYLYELASQLPQAYLGNDIRNAIKNPQLPSSSFILSDPHNKALILLLCYITRIPIPSILMKNQEEVVVISSNLVLSIVDVLSSKQYLKPALLAMELSQMIIQAMWITQSPLMQLPTFTNELCNKCKEKGIEDIADFMNLEDNERNTLMNVDNEEMSEIAKICNRYPMITMDIQLKNNNYLRKDNIEIVVNLKRDYIDEEETVLSNVHSEYFPRLKEEVWWLIVGDTNNNILKTIKRVNFYKGIKINLDFEAPEEVGKYNYSVYLFCDSWIGCDQDESIEFEVIE